MEKSTDPPKNENKCPDSQTKKIQSLLKNHGYSQRIVKVRLGMSQNKYKDVSIQKLYISPKSQICVDIK